jgi:hypothetical protein
MSFEKNNNLEEILQKINCLLNPIEQQQMKLKGNDFSFPSILQIGSPRSGSTFFTQWMADHSIFSHPTNFLSRFYGSPFIGALIYEMLVNPKYDYRKEFVDILNNSEFKSEIGKTKGVKAVHEFWYFWRQHFKFYDVPVDNKTFIQNANFETFNQELSLIQQVFAKPFVLKAHIINFYLKSFAKNMKNAVYIHINRNSVANIRSLMMARKKLNGNVNLWFSWKPIEYCQIKNMDIYHQVAGQIYFIEKKIINDRKYLGDRYLLFSYEDLCKKPKDIYYKILNHINVFSTKKIKEPYKGQKQFTISNPKSEFDDKKIEKAYQYFIDNYGDLQY